MSSSNTSGSNPIGDVSLRFFLPLLAAIVATVPLAVDTYLPAMAVIAQDLDSDMNTMQLTLSLFLAGYAAGLMFFGPLADIFGRRPVVIVGLTGYCIATLLLAFAHSMEQFMLLRFVQAFIGAAATVPITGYIRVIYGKNMAKGLSYVSIIMMLAPMVAPTLGVILLQLSGWPLIFLFLGGYSLLILALSLVTLPKVAAKPRQDSLSNLFFKSYAIVLSERRVRRYILLICFVTLAFFGYITAIPFVYMEVHQVNEKMFGVLFAINVAVFMLTSFTNSRLVGRFGSLNIVKWAMAYGVVCVTSLWLVNVLEMHLYWTVVTLGLYLSALLLISINADALIMIEFSEQTGTAAGVIGTLRFGIGALSGPILAYFYDGSAMPFSYLLVFSMVGIAVCMLFMPHYESDPSESKTSPSAG